ncbi:Protein ECM7 [[Candida] zeylanoides]
MLFIALTNLSTPQRTLQVLRFGAALLALSLTLAAVLGPLLNRTRFYYFRLNCAHLDVASGLYNSLRSSVALSPSVLSSSGAGAFPVDSSLTNSEIQILTQYAESQVASAPQYITNSLWHWCWGNYDTVKRIDGKGRTVYLQTNPSLACQRQSPWVFSYRHQLQQIGLDSILAYAYEGGDFGAAYSRANRHRMQVYRLVPAALFFALASQAVAVVFGYVLYSNRGARRDLSSLPRFLLHVMAALTVASFLGLCVGAALVTHLMLAVQREIGQGLDDYGVTMTFGGLWLSVAWTGVAASAVAMMSWALPLWCANPPPPDLDVAVEPLAFARRPTVPRRDEKNRLIDDDELAREAPPHEAELRRLGHSLSRKSTVRHLPAPRRAPRPPPLVEEPADPDAASQHSQHYREATYDGYLDADAPAAAPVRYANPGNPFVHRNLLAAFPRNRDSVGDSILNEEEMEFLDFSNYVNKI